MQQIAARIGGLPGISPLPVPAASVRGRMILSMTASQILISGGAGLGPAADAVSGRKRKTSDVRPGRSRVADGRGARAAGAIKRCAAGAARDLAPGLAPAE